ncbi:nucleotide-diphospho-sugar transferase [Cerioporus squamosus]|nr:nucleotide-diphospho-sugar transferase [Cerioporus squamosus]
MFRRYKDYLPLSLLPDDEDGTPYRPQKTDMRRRLLTRGLVLVSVLVNLYFVYATLTAWPAPLDDYQSLNTHPIVEERALSSFKPPNPRDNAIVTGLYTDAFATAISNRALCIASVSGWEPLPIERIAPPHSGVHRHFLDQYSKLHLWTLDQRGFESVVYVDADALVRRNFDELFRLPFTFGAVPDVYTTAQGYVTSFNAGVLFLRPDSELFTDMVAKIATARYPAEQAEQAFLNLYFGAEALRLPYAYNANLAIKKRTPALWDALQDEMRIMHFTMAKPFLQGDYDEVPLNKLERNAEKVARKKPAFKREIVEWLEAWHETRRVYRSKLDKCDALRD